MCLKADAWLVSQNSEFNDYRVPFVQRVNIGQGKDLLPPVHAKLTGTCCQSMRGVICHFGKALCLNTFGKAVLHQGGGSEQVERVIERFGREIYSHSMNLCRFTPQAQS